MELYEIITERIKTNGPISFHEYMEMALYYPGLGYYTSPCAKIGPNGDYYTSSSLTRLFGILIGKQLEEMWQLLGEGPFSIVEYGAGTGCLCHDILDYLKNNIKMYDKLSYCIIEKSAAMQQKEQTHLNEKVSWHSSIKELSPVTGCILSNELLDNFSVHQVVMEDKLMEIFVDYKDGFIEVLQPAAPVLQNYLTSLDIRLPKGFRTEINLEAIEWINEVAAAIKRGYVMTIDYGYSSSLLYSQRHSQGTLICYNKHAINYNPYTDIGKQDITAHVNFSALCYWGERNGLNFCGFTNQANFLRGLGFENQLLHLKECSTEQKDFLRYTMLFDMGHKFKILLQQKNAPKNQLSGVAIPLSIDNMPFV